MQALLDLARRAAKHGEVPIAAAVLGPDGQVIAEAHNLVEANGDATQHAEMLALRDACQTLGQKYLENCTLVVTLEPCAMCAQAASLTKVKKIIFGAYDAKGGGVEHGARVFSHATCHHAPEVIGGVMASECGQVLTDFFKAKR